MTRTRTERAKPFQRWVVCDVLPAIRKIGYYRQPAAQATEARAAGTGADDQALRDLIAEAAPGMTLVDTATLLDLVKVALSTVKDLGDNLTRAIQDLGERMTSAVEAQADGHVRAVQAMAAAFRRGPEDSSIQAEWTADRRREFVEAAAEAKAQAQAPTPRQRAAKGERLGKPVPHRQLRGYDKLARAGKLLVIAALRDLAEDHPDHVALTKAVKGALSGQYQVRFTPTGRTLLFSMMEQLKRAHGTRRTKAAYRRHDARKAAAQLN